VSRKVTKFVTRKFISLQGEIVQSARDFVSEVKAEMETVPHKNVLNSDQSGFNKEVRSGRSLDFQGIRKVEKVVQSVNSTTHSYTVQPTVNADGEFVGPLLLVLSEPKGCFGPVVQRTMFKVC